MNEKKINSSSENISELTQHEEHYKKLKQSESTRIQSNYMVIQPDLFDDKFKRLHELCSSDSLEIDSFIVKVRDIQPEVEDLLKKTLGESESDPERKLLKEIINLIKGKTTKEDIFERTEEKFYIEKEINRLIQACLSPKNSSDNADKKKKEEIKNLFLLLNKLFIRSFVFKKYKLSFLLLIVIFILLGKYENISSKFKLYIENYKILFENNKHIFYDVSKDDSELDVVKFIHDNPAGSIALSTNQFISFEYDKTGNMLETLTAKNSVTENIRKLHEMIERLSNDFPDKGKIIAYTKQLLIILKQVFTLIFYRFFYIDFFVYLAIYLYLNKKLN